MQFPRLGFLFLLMLSLIPASAQTIINTDITANTQWTVAGSPYQITNTILIASGVTLTIDPGVSVEVDTAVEIQLGGEVIAQGQTPNATIQFGPLVNGTRWRGFRAVSSTARVDMLRLVVESADYFLVGMDSSIMSESQFLDCDRIVYQSPGFGANTLQPFKFWENQVSTTQGGIAMEEVFALSIATSHFSGYDTVVFIMDSSDIQHSTFTHNHVCLTGVTGTGVIVSEFLENDTAIAPLDIDNGLYIAENIFLGNEVALRIRKNNPSIPSFPVDMGSEQFCNNGISAILENVQSVNFGNSCWCSDDSLEIVTHNFETLPLGNPLPPFELGGLWDICLPGVVYPGDATYDQVVDVFDLLPIGLLYNETGPARYYPNIRWIGQWATGWGDSLLTVDYKHVDCNGDGTIDTLDIPAIVQNYGLTYTAYKRGSAESGVPLYLDNMPPVINPGDTLELDLVLGTMDSSATDIYGLALSLSFDTSLVEDVYTQFDNSWLGMSGNDLIHLDYYSDEAGQLDIGTSRNDQLPMNGYGAIARVIIVIDDDISKKEYELDIEITRAKLIDQTGAEIPVSAQSTQGIISTTSLSDPFTDPSLRAYTTEGYLHVSAASPLRHWQLYTLDGRLAQDASLNMSATQTRIPTQDFPTGLYLLRVETERGWAWKRVRL